MTRLRVLHKTTYVYRRPVNLGAHRLMLRPRESRDLKILAHHVTVWPQAPLVWAHDVFGNVVATVTFAGMTDSLVIDAMSEVQLDASDWPVFPIAASAIAYPFRYQADEWTDLGALTVPQYPDGRLQAWTRGFVRADGIDTLSMLKDLSEGVSAAVQYQSREEEGTQSPDHTLGRGWGSCRDFAVLFVEAVRSLGFGARIVSGYLHNPAQILAGTAGASSTHAWGEVFVPGAGWIAFDPTNRHVGAGNLIPVAVGRSIQQVMPVTGSFVGGGDALEAMNVEVRVEAEGR